MNVLFLASEVAPFAKTGGLADVAGSLPAALRREGVEVRAHLYALRFGTVPVVHATGGLDNAVQQFNRRTGMGMCLSSGAIERIGYPIYFLLES